MAKDKEQVGPKAEVKAEPKVETKTTSIPKEADDLQRQGWSVIGMKTTPAGLVYTLVK